MIDKYVYKVIKRRTRMSAIINGRSKYGRLYKKGKTIYADPNTLGIMCFKTKEEAVNFARDLSGWNYHHNKNFKVVKVKPIGKGKKIHYISKFLTTNSLDNFYSNIRESVMATAPNGTVGYPGVFVVD